MGADPVASVIIPTRDRVAILRECLAALHAQKDAPASWEIVVVDDASTDGTWRYLEEVSLSASIPLRVIRNPGRGPAAARNAGLSEARGEIILMIGDDIIVCPDWIARHVAAHREVAPNVAVLGHTIWDPRMRRTALMEHLDKGAQFGFGKIIDPEDSGYEFFYTSNVSLKRSFLEETGERFDESYPSAAMEDIDLGFRLARRGLRIRYVKEAVAHHFHPITWRSFLERAYLVGQSTAVFHHKFPELRGRRSLGHSRYHPLKTWSCRLLRPVAEGLHWRSAVDRCYRVCFDSERARGYSAQDPSR